MLISIKKIKIKIEIPCFESKNRENHNLFLTRFLSLQQLLKYM